MPEPTTPLIPAEVRARLRSLVLRGSRAAGSRGVGLHASRSRGAGLEFAQYRAYEPGDELRQIDWKLYARSDRFFVREAERESPLTLWLLLDATASAGQCDQRAPRHSRLDTMRSLAACMAEVALRQGDAFALAAVSGAGLELLPPGAGLRQRDRLQLALHRLQPDGLWPDVHRLRPLWERSRPDDLVVMLGDGFDDDALLLAERLAAARRDVVQLQVLTCDERDFPFTGSHRFRDPETGEELLGDGAAMRTDYLARFASAQRARVARLQAAGIACVTHHLDEALDAPLQQLFGAGVRQ